MGARTHTDAVRAPFTTHSPKASGLIHKPYSISLAALNIYPLPRTYDLLPAILIFGVVGKRRQVGPGAGRMGGGMIALESHRRARALAARICARLALRGRVRAAAGSRVRVRVRRARGWGVGGGGDGCGGR